MDTKIVKELKKYFGNREDIVLAFLFGSRASGRARPSSDWDIAVYIKTNDAPELESQREFPEESNIRTELSRLLKNEYDLVVLNRARPSLVFSILNSGLPLSIKSSRLYLQLLSCTHYEAVDFWNFIRDFRRVREQAASLTPEAHALIDEHLMFLENELSDRGKFEHVSWREYLENRDMRRNLERWIENLVMSALDISKIILASDKRDTPQTYRDTLKTFGALYLDEEFAERFAEIADLRNLITHEYLDMRWKKIQSFMNQSGELFPMFIGKVKTYLQ